MLEFEMRKTHLVFVGGFLGAGKTTLLKRAAELLLEAQGNVGLITNDQAENLVDTQILADAGGSVEEVAGGCFCCRFDQLLDASDRLIKERDPDVILGEPVGSCTDVSATVIAPLQRLHGDRFTVAPFTVLVDPRRLRQALLAPPSERGFSDDVVYIFAKQLQEAEIVLLNKTDLLEPGELATFEALLRERAPQARLLAISALTGDGVATWLEAIGALGSGPRTEANPQILEEIDYDRYAAGEAELGWLNLTAELDVPGGFSSRDVVDAVLQPFGDAAREGGFEVAHVKLTLVNADTFCHANLVSADRPPAIRGAAKFAGGSTRLILNARVPMAPDELEFVAKGALARALGQDGVVSIRQVRSLSPAYPDPTHRLAV